MCSDDTSVFNFAYWMDNYMDSNWMHLRQFTSKQHLTLVFHHVSGKLLCCRLVSTYQWRIIPSDLFMEYLNRAVKDNLGVRGF